MVVQAEEWAVAEAVEEAVRDNLCVKYFSLDKKIKGLKAPLLIVKD